MYADCLLKNASIKDNKYVVNQKLEHVDDISFGELFGRIRVFFFVFFLAEGICICVGHSSFEFFMKHSWTNSLGLSFRLGLWLVLTIFEQSMLNLDNNRLYIATGTKPISNDFTRTLYPLIRFFFIFGKIYLR